MYRIFIVEDDEVITAALCAYMARWGFESRGVGDFQHVLAEFAAFDPQLVLMDISLPFFDGYHWCSEMRKVSKVPIVFISSASDNMNILMALSAGADDFIAKPSTLPCSWRRYRRFCAEPMILAGRCLFSLTATCCLILRTARSPTKAKRRS